MIDDKRMSVLDRLIAQADFLTYRPHLFTYRDYRMGYESRGWICKYKTRWPNTYGYGIGSTMQEAYESARDHWRKEEKRMYDQRRFFPTIA